MYYNQTPPSSMPRWLREMAGRWCFVCLVLIKEVDGSTYCLDLSLPPAGVSLLPDQDHLTSLLKKFNEKICDIIQAKKLSCLIFPQSAKHVRTRRSSVQYCCSMCVATKLT